MIVDTGSSTTLIRPQSLAAIGLKTSSSTRVGHMSHPGGILDVPVLTVPELECFGVKVGHLEVACHPLPSESGLHGLLGLDFLRAARMIIDLNSQAIIIPEP